MTEFPLSTSSLEDSIGYKFKNQAILQAALTHSSYANEKKQKNESVKDNERLEFLGDSVLSLITSEFLFFNYSDMPEGEMSKVRAAAVCEKALDEYCTKISLGSYINLGHGEENNNGRTRPSILADAFEALLAAVFIDGGLLEVKRFLLPFITEKINSILLEGSQKDYKTMLQQIVQQEHGEILQYVVVNETGPSHMRIFEVEARLNSNVIGHGTASSKREAEQLAAKEALTLFGD